MKRFAMTKAQAEEHQRKHGFIVISEIDKNPWATPVPRNRMNKTEREYALILEAQKSRREILRYEYEGITLRWAGMRYTPDFVVFLLVYDDWCVYPIRFVEVKGPKIWDRDIVRFKGCRAYWSQFEFEMHQRDKEGRWTRIH